MRVAACLVMGMGIAACSAPRCEVDQYCEGRVLVQIESNCKDDLGFDSSAGGETRTTCPEACEDNRCVPFPAPPVTMHFLAGATVEMTAGGACEANALGPLSQTLCFEGDTLAIASITSAAVSAPFAITGEEVSGGRARWQLTSSGEGETMMSVAVLDTSQTSRTTSAPLAAHDADEITLNTFDCASANFVPVAIAKNTTYRFDYVLRGDGHDLVGPIEPLINAPGLTFVDATVAGDSRIVRYATPDSPLSTTIEIPSMGFTWPVTVYDPATFDGVDATFTHRPDQPPDGFTVLVYPLLGTMLACHAAELAGSVTIETPDVCSLEQGTTAVSGRFAFPEFELWKLAPGGCGLTITLDATGHTKTVAFQL